MLKCLKSYSNPCHECVLLCFMVYVLLWSIFTRWHILSGSQNEQKGKLQVFYVFVISAFLASKVLYFRVGFIAAGLCMLLGSGLMFLCSVTANHPSNHQVIQAAYLRSNMAEERLFEEMNISDSEQSLSSNNTHSHADTASVSDELIHHRDQSPSFEWSQLASGLTTPASDKTKRSHHSDTDISRVDAFHAGQNSIQAMSKSSKSMDYSSEPPCLNGNEDLIWLKRIPDHIQVGSTGHGDTDVTAIHLASPKSKVNHQMTCVPAKTTYV